MRAMRAIVLLAVLTLATLLTLLFVGVQTVKAQYTPDGRGCPLIGDINIISPANTTYSSNMLTLNISVKSLFGPEQYRFVMVYSVDGESNVTVPLTTTFMPIETTITYPNGTTTTGISIMSPYVTAGGVALPELPEGQHKLTVYAKYERTSTNFNYPALILGNSTVYFTISDRKPPAISDLSVENKTYSQNSLPLNFTTDQPTSWIGYCLDGEANVTIAGNATLTGLLEGSHNITVYANDTAGNMGASKTVTFTIDTSEISETFPTKIVASASGALVAFFGLSLLVYFKRRKRQLSWEFK
ncbi:MAG: Ig-like domain-containing protein [Candidatus Bathyarchaeota archaeon]|nr:Ig-like domain-containing protein [Candidatus Bathyarchaeota archaeon]